MNNTSNTKLDLAIAGDFLFFKPIYYLIVLTYFTMPVSNDMLYNLYYQGISLNII